MELAVALAIIASIIDLWGSVIYIKDVLGDRCRPSITSWGVWSFLAVLSCVSYVVMTGDIVKGILPIVSTAACVLTLVLALFKGHATKLQRLDYWALAIGITAGFVWWIFKNATCGNLLLQPGFIMAYIPTYAKVWKDSRSEKALPWLVWCVVFLLQITIVRLRWRGQYQDLVPISGLITCAIVPILTLRKSQLKKSVV